MRLFSSRWRRIGLALAGVAGLSLVGASAYAAIPDPSGQIHGCYDNRFGVLRVIDPAKTACQTAETPIAWNQTGPAGPQGDPGSSHLYLTRKPLGESDVLVTTTADTTVLSQSLPAGTFLVQARLVVLSYSFDHKEVWGRCQLTHDGATRDDEVPFTVPGLPQDAVDEDPPESDTVSLQASITLTAPATVTLSCAKHGDSEAPAYTVQNSVLSALQVAALN